MCRLACSCMHYMYLRAITYGILLHASKYFATNTSLCPVSSARVYPSRSLLTLGIFYVGSKFIGGNCGLLASQHTWVVYQDYV